MTKSNEPNSLDQTQSQLQRWAEEAQSGELSWTELAERILSSEATHRDAFHHPDTDRTRRCGFGEVVYGEGKSTEDIRTIANTLLDNGQTAVLVTRVDADSAKQLSDHFPIANHNPVARTLKLARVAVQASGEGSNATSVIVVTAGSTDRPVALEAMETLEWMQVPAKLITDVGVAGPYRLLPHLEQLRAADVVVVVAGMEGALVSVVGGLVSTPVIAVPTSVGYGANLGGVTTLLGMLSSCAAGVTVVNIDAGFKGGYVAGLIANRVQRAVHTAAAE